MRGGTLFIRIMLDLIRYVRTCDFNLNGIWEFQYQNHGEPHRCACSTLLFLNIHQKSTPPWSLSGVEFAGDIDLKACVLNRGIIVLEDAWKVGAPSSRGSAHQGNYKRDTSHVACRYLVINLRNSQRIDSGRVVVDDFEKLFRISQVYQVKWEYKLTTETSLI